MSTMWSSVKSFSNALISSAAVERLFSSLLPSKRSLSKMRYQLRSRIVMRPRPGIVFQKRHKNG